MNTSEFEKYLSDYEAKLEARYGLIVGLPQIKQLLNYTSMSAIHQAAYKGKLPIPIFKLEHRKGKYALTRDIAQYLVRKRFEKRCRGTLNHSN